MPPKLQPVSSYENLRLRVERLLKTPYKAPRSKNQLSFALDDATAQQELFLPHNNVAEFLDFLTAAVPHGDLYLFGGLIRDIALQGRSGFSSDIDLVVEGRWEHCASYLESLGAKKNKFGGFRLNVGSQPIDIWNAEDTWAFRQRLVAYDGVGSLTKTTVLNWDAILMNWRTGGFLYKEDYLEELNAGFLDIVLRQNPNPLGMAVRVFRHFCTKDTKKLSLSAVNYMASCTSAYSFEELKCSEIRSYGNALIEPAIYRFFKRIDGHDSHDVRRSFADASHQLQREGVSLSNLQIGLRI